MNKIEETPIEPLILLLRGKRAILDADLARLYGVTTKRLNEQVRRNARRFPESYAFKLLMDELKALCVYPRMELGNRY